jgi:hypothetical protein
MKALYKKALFRTVRRAMQNAHIDCTKQDENSILVWHDTIAETADYFKELKSFQIVNRLPHINLICRKAGLIQTIHRLLRPEERETRSPNLFPFLPRSFILPKDWQLFEYCRSETNKRYIVKPDQGSLGCGITIVKPGDPFTPRTLCIAQEYIESRLIENRKFDLRIYVLVAAVSPLTVYVYREGIARFCSETDGSDSRFSQITNTAVNRQNSAVAITDITRPISEVFDDLKKENVAVSKVWGHIDDVVIQTILSISDFLKKGVLANFSSFTYSRCFQILGFDILLDKNLKPYLLEVNYRPSLGFDFPEERAMKEMMLASAMKIVAPYAQLQKLLPTAQWRNKYQLLLGQIQKTRDDAVRDSFFQLVFTEGVQTSSQAKWYTEVLRRVGEQKYEVDNRYHLPVDKHPPAPVPEKSAPAAKDQKPPSKTPEKPIPQKAVGSAQSGATAKGKAQQTAKTSGSSVATAKPSTPRAGKNPVATDGQKAAAQPAKKAPAATSNKSSNAVTGPLPQLEQSQLVSKLGCDGETCGASTSAGLPQLKP